MSFTRPSQRSDLRIAAFSFILLAALQGRASGGAREVETAEVYIVRLTIGPSGFEPKRVAVPLGAVHFVVTSKEGDHCFAIPSLDVEKRVRASRTLEVDVAFDRTGEFPFRCCVESAANAEAGMVVVTPAK